MMQRIYPQDRLETDSDQESYRSLAYDATNEQTRFNSATVGISAPSSWAPERPWAPAIKRLPTPFFLSTPFFLYTHVLNRGPASVRSSQDGL